jgi:aryl-alcohol dehydrogenase-like predicted oxidoreductase
MEHCGNLFAMDAKISFARRSLLLSSAALALVGTAHAAVQRRAIGKSGTQLPVIGIGTNRFRLDNRAVLGAVLRRMAELGGTVIDTAAGYGESEETIGAILQETGLRERVFLATKLTAPAPGSASPLTPQASFERSLQRLRTDHVDLLQVHNLQGTAEIMPLLAEWKSAGKIRYSGLTTSRAMQHAQLIAELETHPVDFIQVDYSIGNRAAADLVLPAAQARGIAVLVNLPLGGGRGENVIARAGTRPLPSFARRAGIASWAQFGLVYVISHPAVTCAIPGSTRVAHVEDNQAAAGLRPVNARFRKQMEQYWDAEIAGGT